MAAPAAALESPRREPVPAMAPALATAPSPPARSPGRWWLWGDPDPWPERQGQRWS